MPVKKVADEVSAKSGFWWLADNIIIWLFARMLNYWRWRTGKPMFAMIMELKDEPQAQVGPWAH